MNLCISLLAAVAVLEGISAFTPTFHHASYASCAASRSHLAPRQKTFFMSTEEDGDSDGPSDVEYEYDGDDNESTSSSISPERSNAMDVSKALQKLLELAARTGRGEHASREDKEDALELISAMEANNPSSSTSEGMAYGDKAYGRWELVYSSTQLFRSSPFFMAGRAVCETEEQAQQYNWFCDMHRKALSISQIGTVRQIISPTRMVSEFEVKVGAVPFLRKFTPFAYSGGLPVVIEGAIVSSADLTATDEGDAWELFMDTVEIKGSNIPGLRQVLDSSGVKLESRRLGQLLESNVPNYSNPRPVFETTYLDDSIRIGRDQDGNAFVYSKISDNMDPTNYSGVTSDLGIARLLEGFNDSVTKFYL